MCSPRRGEDQHQDDPNGPQSLPVYQAQTQATPHPEESQNPQKQQRSQKAIPDEEMVHSIPKSNLEENPEQQSIGKALSLTAPTHPGKFSSRRKKGKSDIKEEPAAYERVSVRKRRLHPVPFTPSKIFDFPSHETLLKGLGLWEFVNMEFYQEVNADLITQLVDTYDPKLKRSFVNGLKIRVSRADLGRALGLPLKKRRCLRNVALSEEIIEFIEDFVSIWMLLQEDTWVIPREVLNWMGMIKDGNPEKVDWAGLLWFMVEKELTLGAQLEDCYYAVHLQCLIKSQCGEVYLKEPENVELDEFEDQEQEKIPLGGPDIDLSVGLLTSEKKEEVVDAEEQQEEEEEQWPSGRNDEPVLQMCAGNKALMIWDDQEEKREDCKNLVEEEDKKDDFHVLANGDENLIQRIEVNEPVLSLCTTSKDGMMILDDQEENKDKMVDAEEAEEEELCPSGRNYESFLQPDTGKEGMMILDDQEEKKEEHENLVGKEETKDESHVLANVDGNLFQIVEVNEPVLLLSTTGEESVVFHDHDEKNEESKDLLYKEGSGGECMEEEEREDEFYALASGNGNLLQRMESDDSLLQLRTTTCEEGVILIDLEEKKEDSEEDERENNGNSLLKHDVSQVPFHGEPYGSGSSKRGANEHNNHQSQGTNKRPRADCVPQQPLDFGTCMTEIQQLLSQAKMAKEARDLKREQHILHQQTLTLECHKRDTVIARLQRAKFEELQKREAMILRLERELSTMNNILNGYRNALKGVNREFAQCRELARIRLKQEEEGNAMRLVLKEIAKEAEEGYAVEFGMHEDKVIAMGIRLMSLSSKVDELKELWARQNGLKKAREGSANE